MITIISNNEYKAWAEKAFRRFCVCTTVFQSSEHFHVCRRAEMSVKEALVDGKAGVPLFLPVACARTWWSLPSLAQMYSPQTNPIIVWPFFRPIARSGTNHVPFSTMAVFRRLWLTGQVEEVIYWNSRVPFGRGHTRRKRWRRSLGGGESVCAGSFYCIHSHEDRLAGSMRSQWWPPWCSIYLYLYLDLNSEWAWPNPQVFYRQRGMWSLALTVPQPQFHHFIS